MGLGLLILVCCLQNNTVAGRTVGSLLLTSSEGVKWDACLELKGVNGSAEGGVFKSLYNIRMLLMNKRQRGTLDSLAMGPDQQTSDNLGSAAQPRTFDRSAVVEEKDLGLVEAATASATAPNKHRW